MSYNGKKRVTPGAYARGSSGYKERDCDRCHVDLTPVVTYAGNQGPRRARMPRHLEVTFHTVGVGGTAGKLPHPNTLHLCEACAVLVRTRWAVLVDQLLT